MIIKKKSLDTGKRKFGAVLGDNVKTGVNVSLMPGVKKGVNSAIGPNMIVTHDVPDNTLLTVLQHVTYKTFKDLTRA